MKLINQINWKVLLISLITQFSISFLLHLGVKSPQVLQVLSVDNLKPQIQSITTATEEIMPGERDIISIIKPKLEQNIDGKFEIKEESSIIPPAFAADDFDRAEAYLAIDYNSGQVLTQKNMSKPISIASLTKIMTAVVALDLASPEEKFTVTKTAADFHPTKIGVVEGQTMSLEELLNALLLTSANDAAQVIKDGVDHEYQQGVFVMAMNTKASFLGLKNTHFDNPQGLDSSGNYSSAQDLAILTHYALTKYPIISQIVQKDYQYLPETPNHKQFDLFNWNGLLDVYPGVEGVKIGNTGMAGYTTVVVSERDNQKVLAVLLGAPGVLERDLWTSKLLDFGFEKYGLPAVGVTTTQLKAKYATWQYWN